MNIKELRRKKNLSQEELSSQTGIPRARLAKWEQGLAKPKAEDLRTLEKFFSNNGKQVDNDEPSGNQAADQQEPSALDKLAQATLLAQQSIAKMVNMLEAKERTAEQMQASLNELLQNQYAIASANTEYQRYVIEAFWKVNGRKVDGNEVLSEIHQKAFEKFVQMQTQGIQLV